MGDALLGLAAPVAGLLGCIGYLWWALAKPYPPEEYVDLDHPDGGILTVPAWWADDFLRDGYSPHDPLPPAFTIVPAPPYDWSQHGD